MRAQGTRHGFLVNLSDCSYFSQVSLCPHCETFPLFLCALSLLAVSYTCKQMGEGDRGPSA